MQYYVYIATNKINTVLYTGVTNNLERRMCEHKNKLVSGFTARYNIQKLIYYEIFPTALEAIEAEKKIKGWTRQKKIDLVLSMNPFFKDLFKEE
ncbi:MAG: GIY-YIG nuclease family protein [Patescibacteria group bacterium]